MELIDTHQHLMYRDQVGYSWANEFPPIDKGNFTIEDYKELTKDFDIKDKPSKAAPSHIGLKPGTQ